MQPLSRRGVLAMAGGATASLILGGCSGENASAPGRFVGDPGRGRLYYGAALPANRSVTGWESRLGATMSVHRSYFTATQLALLLEQVRRDHARDRLPHVSVKTPGSWADLAAGRDDRWVADLLEGLANRPLPTFLTVHHEPENDSGGPGMQAADYVSMQERVIDRAAEVAGQVTVVPVLQHWTFEPRNPAGHPEPWIVPAARVLGVDIYNPWAPHAGKPWIAFADKLADVLPFAAERPVVIGEYGCRIDPEDPGRAGAWMRAAFREARGAGVISMSYFNSHRNSGDGSWELDVETERVFRQQLHHPAVARVNEAPAS